MGGLGIVAAVSLGILLASHFGYPLSLVAAMGSTSLAAFLLMALLTKLVTKEERLVYHRNVLAVFFLNVLLLKLSAIELFPCLDGLALCIGLFLAFGRIGCLLVGCCHGRPCLWGVRYGREQVQTGFPPWLAGVRLFPVQGLESLWVFGIVFIGIVSMWRGSPPGSILSFYIVAYAFGRFFLEFFRGDDARPYVLSFSEAQWISLASLAGIALAERFGLLPSHRTHLALLISLCIWMAGSALLRLLGRSSSDRLFSASHINEMARTVVYLRSEASTLASRFAGNPRSLRLAETSQRLQMSFGRVHRYRSCLAHFSISRPEHLLTGRDAKRFARLLANLLHFPEPCRIMNSRGVYHFLFYELPSPPAAPANDGSNAFEKYLSGPQQTP
jgi:hypothetical protein